MRDFTHATAAHDVIFAPGALDRIGALAERAGWRRLYLCTTHSQRTNGHVTRIEALLGGRLAGIYDSAAPHVPDAQVAEVAGIADSLAVDVLIGLGGGSALGLAKAASWHLEELHPESSAHASPPTTTARVPVIAIPTTYAGSEMTPVFGVTRSDGERPIKTTVGDPRIAPRMVIYDPLLTRDLPPELGATTGMNALAHCIEALYSISRNPVSTAAALEAIHIIMRALPRCHADGSDIEVRSDMLAGAYLAGVALSGVAMGLHHGVCHVLGGTAGVPHGLANSIMLPHAMRFNLEATAAELARAAAAMGLDTTGQFPQAAAGAAVDAVAALTRQMGLPQRLRDAGVREEDIPTLARLAMQSRAVQANPLPVTDPAQIESLLRAAW
ncbi:MAG TPA: iron-containing alcohol dehydrogenase [Ktedonobacterales bacterium]|nr:iron-containing alcohol dehydrogenase [Ktedonobacterales bacterium]